MPTKYQSRVFDVVAEHGIEYVAHKGGVAILPLMDCPACQPVGCTRCGGAGFDVMLIEQPRMALGQSKFIEIPAGTRDVKGETVERTALRELTEETGFKAGSIAPLGVFAPTCGYSNEIIHLFVGSNLEKAEEPLPDEKTRPLTVTFPQMQKLVLDMSVIDSKAMLAFLLYEAKRTELDWRDSDLVG